MVDMRFPPDTHNEIFAAVPWGFFKDHAVAAAVVWIDSYFFARL